MGVGETRDRDVPWKHRDQLYPRRQLHTFTSNCSTAILAGAAKEKWKIVYPEALAPREFQEVLWKGMKTGLGSQGGEQGSRENIPGSGA